MAGIAASAAVRGTAPSANIKPAARQANKAGAENGAEAGEGGRRTYLYRNKKPVISSAPHGELLARASAAIDRIHQRQEAIKVSSSP